MVYVRIERDFIGISEKTAKILSLSYGDIYSQLIVFRITNLL